MEWATEHHYVRRKHPLVEGSASTHRKKFEQCLCKLRAEVAALPAQGVARLRRGWLEPSLAVVEQVQWVKWKWPKLCHVLNEVGYPRKGRAPRKRRPKYDYF